MDLFNRKEVKQLRQDLSILKVRLEHAEVYTATIVQENKQLTDKLELAGEELSDQKRQYKEISELYDEKSALLESFDRENRQLRERKDYLVRDVNGELVPLAQFVDLDLFDEITLFVAERTRSGFSTKPAHVIESSGSEIVLGNSNLLDKPKPKSRRKKTDGSSSSL